MAGLYVQVGCGVCAPEGWRNFDASPRLRVERMAGIGSVLALTAGRLFPASAEYGDVRSGLPVGTGTADGVYASHVLEHVSRDDVAGAMAEMFRVLRVGGVLRLVVPDLRARAERYVREGRGDDFMASLNMAGAAQARGVLGRARAAFGFSGHRWMYDEASMAAVLTAAGFAGVRRCAFGDSGDPMFDRVEDRGRFFHEGVPELAMQAMKP